MVKASLVDADVEAGTRVIEALDKARFPVQAALWFYLSEPGEWRLLVASPEVDERGPKKAYTHLQSVLARPSVGLSLRDISLVSPDHDLIRLLSRAISTGPGISGIRFTANTVDNVFIEDAYIYRLQ